jgi:hypothetical protein
LKLDWSSSGLYNNTGMVTITPVADQAKVKAVHSKLSMLGLFGDTNEGRVDGLMGSDSSGPVATSSSNSSTSNALFKDDVNFSSTRKESQSTGAAGEEFSWRSLKVF